MPLIIYITQDNNQPGTKNRKHHNPTLSSYAVILQKVGESNVKITNIELQTKLKSNVIVLYDTKGTNDFPSFKW